MPWSWGLLCLTFVPGIFGLVVLMNWLEVYLTHQEVADEVAAAWLSTDAADDLEQKVSSIVKRLMIDVR